MSAALTDFLYWVEEIAGEKPAYRSGGSGKDGTCDCIGLVIGALRRAGGSWPGIHGSNYAARNETDSLSEIRSPADLSVGELVFKHRAPGDPGYSLPARYSKDPDRNDYYHIGIVLSASPLRIRHMTTPAPALDEKLGKWSHHGWCRRIAKPQKEGVTSVPENNPGNPSSGPNPPVPMPLPQPVFIESLNGLPVKLRSGPSTSCALY